MRTWKSSHQAEDRTIQNGLNASNFPDLFVVERDFRIDDFLEAGFHHMPDRWILKYFERQLPNVFEMEARVQTYSAGLPCSGECGRIELRVA